METGATVYYIKQCVQCGKGFNPENVAQQTICSNECRNARIRESKHKSNGTPQHLAQQRAYRLTERLAKALGINVAQLSTQQIEIEGQRMKGMRRTRQEKREAKALAKEAKRNAPPPKCRACGNQFEPVHCQRICSEKCRKEMNCRAASKRNNSPGGKQYHKEYYQRPEVIAKQRTPEKKAARRKYAKEYGQRPEVKERRKKQNLERKANAPRLTALKKNG